MRKLNPLPSFLTRAQKIKILFIKLRLSRWQTRHCNSVLGSRHFDIGEEQAHILNYVIDSFCNFCSPNQFQDVSGQLWVTLYDYPSLKSCQALKHYIRECVLVSWALTVQNPPFVIDYDNTIFDENLHERFYLSNPESSIILSFIWPTLLEGEGGPCAFKGVITTQIRSRIHTKNGLSYRTYSLSYSPIKI